MITIWYRKFVDICYLSYSDVLGTWYCLIHKILNYCSCQFLYWGGQEILWEVTIEDKKESEATQSCPTLQPHGLFLRPWDFPGKSTGVDCHFLLQGTFPTQALNPGLPHCRQTLLPSEPPGKSQCRVKFSHLLTSPEAPGLYLNWW